MEEQSFLYETTLDLLGGSAESNLVLRNKISLSSAEGPTAEEPKSDFLSLDLKKEDEVEESSVLVTPVAVKEKLEPSTPAPEKNLEGNWFRANSRLKSPMIRLHKEILDFCDFLSPTAEEQECRNAAIESVFDAIKHIWPKAKVEVFGSFKTGLYLPTSDIDVVILDSYIQRPKDGLCALSKELSQRKIAKKIQVIAKARVPIIKFVEKKSGFAFDVSFDAHNGPKAAEYIKDAVSKWPPLRPLCLILKVFLQQRELNEVYTGGIGSYALLAMLIAMLRTQQESQTSAEHNLGILLVKFFDMYGCKLNTVDVGVSCNGRAIFFPKSSKGFSVEGRPSLISIEDPETPDNDIGKNSFNYYQARSSFSMAFTTLTNAKAILRLDPNKSILSSIIRPDAILLERKGGNQTLNNLFPGTGEPLNQLFSEQQEMYCNFQLDNEDEEPLPRGNGTAAPDSTVKSSGKKRKSPKEKNKSAKKAKGHMNNMVEKHGNGSVEPSKKKQSRRYHQNGGDCRGYSARGAGSSN